VVASTPQSRRYLGARALDNPQLAPLRLVSHGQHRASGQLHPQALRSQVNPYADRVKVEVERHQLKRHGRTPRSISASLARYCAANIVNDSMASAGVNAFAATMSTTRSAALAITT
jgi:hypothetical protein